jgi:glycosyltransferase involved in cell wall biosynthesis
MYATATAMAGAHVARRASIPHVVTTFGRDLGVGRTDERYAAMVARTLASATHVVAANAAVAEQAAPMLRKHNSHLTRIPMGVDDSLFGDPPGFVESRSRIGIDPSRSVVLVVQSAFNEDKRLETVLQALAELNDPEALLVVVGRDDSLGHHRERSLRRLAAGHGVSDRIIWAGQQPHSRLPFYYGAADVLVDARATSSFSSCILEAMWASVPVVATAASAASGTVPPDVLAGVVPTDDAARLGKALSSILHDKRRSRALGRAGWQWITVNGSANSIGGVVEAYGKVYKLALRSGAVA